VLVHISLSFGSLNDDPVTPGKSGSKENRRNLIGSFFVPVISGAVSR
jgi:hypothetical protein